MLKKSNPDIPTPQRYSGNNEEEIYNAYNEIEPRSSSP
jgi:hypothetical protein